MSRNAEIIALLLADAVALFLANWLFQVARFQWGLFTEPVFEMAVVWTPIVLLTGFWLVLFFFAGLYRERYAASRFDELVSLMKVVTVGILVLFFLLFIDALDAESARTNLLFYWATVFVLVAAGRIAVRSVQKALILRGYGVHKALIVGWSEQVEQLYDDVARYPAAGLRVVGAIRMRRDGTVPVPAGGDGASLDLGGGAGDTDVLARQALETEVQSIEALPRLIDELGVQDVLIALGSEDRGPLMEVLRLCDGKPVSLKLVPDFYTVIGGMARTEHIYGLPLIEVMPEPMPAWEESAKRLIDLSVSLLVLVLGLPLWVTLGVLVRLTSPGPAIYRQVRVGRHGRPFTMYKFRTMHQNAEAETGPVWAREDDPRYTPLGRWLRRTRLDEIPQFWNVLKGDMSLVGPRPERPYFVEKLAREIPLYNRRHRVKPGITGWAQVKWKYDESLEDVRQKVKFDLFYIENMSLRMDFKILFRTVVTALRGEGQ
ncbi:exopolysaccharide biosynthesis polyprenyl glycosylphosphotransferase [Rhodothermaceae bacterium RA]|nr:exopolysaccharide biosynthesis polyprenyl glycosylphosphotransferase [Rhodothermaceae bacterium RA]